MPFNISTFKSNIEKHGYLSTNKFQLIVTPPPTLINNNVSGLGSTTGMRNIMEILHYRIEQIKAPGIGLLTADYFRYGIGSSQKMPFSSQVNELGIVLLMDRKAFGWQFWHNWIKTIYEFNGTDTNSTGTINKAANYLVEYKDNYSAPMQIIIYDSFGNAAQKINLYEAFPTGIRDTPLAWSDQDNLLRIGVNISFKEFIIETNTLSTY